MEIDLTPRPGPRPELDEDAMMPVNVVVDGIIRHAVVPWAFVCQGPGALSWWIREGGDVNAVCERIPDFRLHDVDDSEQEGVPSCGCTILMHAVSYCEHPGYVRGLLARGADVHRRDDWGTTALGYACDCQRPWKLHLTFSALLEAGADPNLLGNRPPKSVFLCLLDGQVCNSKIMKALLRHGASMDLPYPVLQLDGPDWVTVLENSRRAVGFVEPGQGFLPRFENQAAFDACFELATAVRDAGGWRKYCILPHKQLLTLRSLRAQDRARLPPMAPTATQESRRAARLLDFLLDPSLPNGIVWHILTYWSGQEEEEDNEEDSDESDDDDEEEEDDDDDDDEDDGSKSTA